MNLLDVERDATCAELRQRVRAFVDGHAIPMEGREHIHDPQALDAALAKLRPMAREQGLYLPQMPRNHGGLGLSWVQRFVVLEEAGRSYLGPGALNCAAPKRCTGWPTAPPS